MLNFDISGIILFFFFWNVFSALLLQRVSWRRKNKDAVFFVLSLWSLVINTLKPK